VEERGCEPPPAVSGELGNARNPDVCVDVFCGVRGAGFQMDKAAPPGIGSVQTFSGRRVDVDLDGTIEMSAEDAQYYIRDGWIELAE
jgi:hypothetical protein